MDRLCKVCDRWIVENESEYNKYLATSGKKKHKILYNKFSINNVNLDEVIKILNNYISTHIKNFDFCCNNNEFAKEYDNNFTANINYECCYNTDIVNIIFYLIYYIDCYESREHKFYNINQVKINIISDRCNMTYERFINQPMSI